MLNKWENFFRPYFSQLSISAFSFIFHVENISNAFVASEKINWTKRTFMKNMIQKLNFKSNRLRKNVLNMQCSTFYIYLCLWNLVSFFLSFVSRSHFGNEKRMNDDWPMENFTSMLKVEQAKHKSCTQIKGIRNSSIKYVDLLLFLCISCRIWINFLLHQREYYELICDGDILLISRNARVCWAFFGKKWTWNECFNDK